MTVVFITILILYLVLVMALLAGWVRIRRQPMPPRTAEPPAASVVVAFRNEARHLDRLVQDLSGSAFPADRFEIILVNDHSEDKWAEIVETRRRLDHDRHLRRRAPAHRPGRSTDRAIPDPARR